MRNGKRASQSGPSARPLSTSISRRQALHGLGLGVGALALGGCPGAPAADSPPAPDLASGPGPDAGLPPDLASPADLATPSPGQLLQSVDAIVVLMMENRSFDHYLGSLRGDSGYAARGMLDGLLGTESNPDPTMGGMPIYVFPTDNRTPKDPPHMWDACHAQWNGGKNDGFVQQHAMAGAGSERNQVMGFHNRASIPLYYALADRFTVCDRWFASVMGPTWPNRFYLHSASSFGKKDNSPITDGKVPTVWERLRDKGMRGKNYSASLVAFYSGGYLGKTGAGTSPVSRMNDFFDDCKAGSLPPFSIIDPDFLTNDDHPSHDINLGQAFMATVVQAIAQSPQWSRTLLVVTYDEHGGFFDHVPPPAAADERDEFRQLGFRVPTIVIGPTVRAGQVVHTTFDHASVAATLRTRYDIASLGPRMDAAADLSSCIDPARLHSPAPPPTGLPTLKVNLRAALASTETNTFGQPELQSLVANGLIPRTELDERPAAERLRSWLERGAALGAIELV